MPRKGWLLLISLIVLVSLAILAASLHDVQFQAGKSLAFESGAGSAQPTAITAQAISDIPLLKLLLLWGAFTVNLILFFFLLPPETRRKILGQMIRFSLTILILMIALRYRLIRLPFLNLIPTAPPGQPALNLGDTSASPVFQPPALTSWMSYLISAGILLGLLLLASLVYRRWERSRLRRSSSLSEIAAIAQTSLDDLAAGRNWGDVVVQSYLQMSAAVSRGRGFVRPVAMTPREFAERLDRAGLPGEAVKNLTRLFESVRYGAHASKEKDIREARACLDSILQACGAAE